MKRWAIPVLAATAAIVGRPAVAETPSRPQAALSSVAEDAFVYGYPLVLMGLTAGELTSAPATSAYGAPINRFRHVDRTAIPGDRAVVRPNTDTLYSSAWLDLSRGPLVLHVPDTLGRYFVAEMLDAWTNVFAAPGTRTLGSAPRDIAFVGPRWQGALPPGLAAVRAPTSIVWIIGRTQILGPGDLPAARAVQRQLTIAPLGSSAGEPLPLPAASPGVTPPEAIASMDASTFLSTLATLMRDNPAPPRDALLLSRLASIGFVPGRPYEPGPAAAASLDVAKQRAEQRIAAAARRVGAAVNGWRVVLRDIGTYGTNYDARAAIAKMGLGANLPADAVYPITSVDGDGRPLHGDHRYVVHFAPGRLPPVNAFWSLTLYDASGYLVPNAIGRYALHDRDPLRPNPDGSLDLYIQASSPGPERETNWLPAPAGAPFNLTLRLYWPRRAVLEGAWVPPPVVAIERGE